MSSEIKPLDEKMAQELADAFTKCLESTAEISGMFEHIFQLGYWDRKARKAYNNFFDMCEYVKNEISKSGMKLAEAKA